MTRTPSAGLDHPWPEAPPHGRPREVAPGIRWLRMPLPFRLDHVNLYLLEDRDGWTVVDAGIGLDRTRDLWEAVLQADLDGRPVTRVFVTHFHPDHMGNARWLAERCGADLWCSQAEWLMAHFAWRLGDTDERLDFYRRNGIEAAQREALGGRRNHYRQVTPAVAPSFRAVRDGDVLEIGERSWHALTVFGHSPEQAILHCPEAGVLVSGDQVLPRITTNVSVWPGEPLGNPLRLYLGSLGRLAGMRDDTLVLPAHGLPFRGLQTRLGQLRRHHDERLGRTLDAVAEEPLTAAEVLPALFSRDLDLQQFGFAFGETLAHLHYLEWQGRVKRLVGPDGRHRFQRG